MEITEIKITQHRVKATHSTSKYVVDYDVALGEDNKYEFINGVIKETTTDQIVGYINKSYELSIRTVNSKENLFIEISEFVIETLPLLDEKIKTI